MVFKNDEKKSISANYSKIDFNYIDKIKISWNVGLGDYRTFISEYNMINKYIIYLQTKILGFMERRPV